LDEAIDILRVAEAASTQAKNLTQGDAMAIQALSKSSYKKDKLNKSSKPQHKQQSSSFQSSQSKKDDKSVKFDTSSKGCWNCGGETRHPRSECPANGKDCGKCGKTGHFRKVCNSSSNKKNTTPSTQTGCIGLEPESPAQVSGIGALELVRMNISPKEGNKSVRPNWGAYREYAKTGSQRVSACIACPIDSRGVQQRESCEKGYSIYSGANEGKSDFDGSCSWWSWTSGLVELDQRAGVAGPASWCGWTGELV
jgi:hypothetical protein